MKIKTVLSTALIVSMTACASTDESAKEEKHSEPTWKPIFNGTSLEGWIPKFNGYALGENYKDTFRVEDGYLTVSYDNYDRFTNEFGHLFYETPYSHYRIRATYRFIEHKDSYEPNGPKLQWALRNNGLMLHAQAPETMAVNQDFPASIEVQLLGGLGKGPRPTANVCTPSTHVVLEGELVTKHCIKSSSETYEGDQWVDVEVEVRGGELMRNYVNGELVFELENPQLDGEDPALVAANGGTRALTKGYITIQAETHPTQFKSIEIMVLD